jgi:hypothetical protein
MKLLRPLLLVALAVPAQAQVRSAALVSQNDAYNFWIPVATRPDREYTNGVELALALDAAPLWRRVFPGLPTCAGTDPAAACLSTRIRAGQKIFTPRVEAASLLPGQRPHAGWLYVAAAGSVERERLRRTAEVEAGVTGPPSQAERVQTAFHRMAGFEEPQGWDGQLRTEPGVVLRIGEESVVAQAAPGGVRVAELVPEWGLAAGNVRTAAHAGARVRAGYRVPHPWRPAPGAALYASASLRGDLVLRDLFLDGNTFRDGPRVERIPGVRELRYGGGLRLGRVGAEYQVVHRTRSYRTEPEGHTYGSFEITFR